MCIDQNWFSCDFGIDLMEMGCRSKIGSEMIDKIGERGISWVLFFDEPANFRVDDLHYNALEYSGKVLKDSAKKGGSIKYHLQKR